MSSHLSQIASYTGNGNINEDPACTNVRWGWYTRSSSSESNANSNVRQLRIRQNYNTIYPTSDIAPNNGYTVQDDNSIYYDGYIWKPGTYRGSQYGWDNAGVSCGYQAPPNGDWCNAFDIIKYNTNINAYIEVSPTVVGLGQTVDITYFTSASGGANVARSTIRWQRSTQTTNGTYNYNTYTFTPGVDQTDYFIEIEDTSGNVVRDSVKIVVVGEPSISITSDAPIKNNRSRILLGATINLTVTSEVFGGDAYIEYNRFRYPYEYSNPNGSTFDSTTNAPGQPDKFITSYSHTPGSEFGGGSILYFANTEDSYGQTIGRGTRIYVDDPPAPVARLFIDDGGGVWIDGDVTINIGESIVLRFYLIGQYVTSMYYTDGTNTTNYTNGDEQGIIEITLTPTVTTTYTVGGTGDGAYGTTLNADPVSHTVTVISDPPLPYVSADPTTIITGDSTTITYGAEGTTVDSMTLTYGGSSLLWNDGTERTVDVTLTQTTTFTCSASNAAGSGDDATVDVIVLTPPTASLTVDQSATCPGEDRTFSYEITGNFNSAEILNPDGTQEVSINPLSTVDDSFTSSVPGTYTLNVYAGYGDGAYDVVKTVTLTELVTTTADLVGTGVTIYNGSSVTLSWYVQGSGVQVSIDNGVGIVDQNSYTSVSPTVDTTYTLTAGGTCNTVTDTFTVTVLPPPPTSASPELSATPLEIIEGEFTQLLWSATDEVVRDISTYTLTDVDNPGAKNPSTGYKVYPSEDRTYTYEVITTYTKLDYTNSNTFVGWISPGVPCPTGYWKCDNNVTTPNGLIADKCCQVINSTSTATITENTSVFVTVYEIPELTLSVSPSSTMIVGDQRTLEWSTSGDADTLVWVSPTTNPPTNTNLTSIEIVAPTVTTTYSAYPSGLGGIGTTKSVTITVYQLPTLDVTWPQFVYYGEQVLIEYTAQYADVSVILTPTYYYLEGEIQTGDPVELSHPNSAEFGIGITEVTDEYTTEIPWDNRGVLTIVYTIKATGSGGNVIDTHTLAANIDITPTNNVIEDSEDLLINQDPVITPKDIISDQYVIDDIDIDVEIKADKPIQVQVNDDNNWQNLREL